MMKLSRFQFLILFFLFSPFLILAQAKTAGNGFIIEGKITSIPENTQVILSGFNANDTLAKSEVHNGTFILKGNVENTDARMLVFPALQKRMVLFMSNDSIQISGSSEFTDINITGSPANDDYNEFLYHIKPLNDFVELYRNQLQVSLSKPYRDSIIIMLNTAYNIYQNSIDRFLSRKKSSPVAALLLAYSYDTDPNKDVMLLEKRFTLLEGDALQTQFAQNVQQVVANDKIGAVGTQSLDFTQTDIDGKNVSLSQFRGKYVLLDFWASWCKPCRIENPNVVAAYDRFKNKNFTILSVSLDKEKGRWLAAIEADHLNWTHVSDLKFWDNEVAKLYHVHEIPQNMLIDPEGKIIAKNLTGEMLTSKLEEVLNK